MKISPETTQEFIDLTACKCGETMDRDEAEHMIRQLFAFYRPLYEWHHDRNHRPQLQTEGAGS